MLEAEADVPHGTNIQFTVQGNNEGSFCGNDNCSTDVINWTEMETQNVVAFPGDVDKAIVKADLIPSDSSKPILQSIKVTCLADVLKPKLIAAAPLDKNSINVEFSESIQLSENPQHDFLLYFKDTDPGDTNNVLNVSDAKFAEIDTNNTIVTLTTVPSNNPDDDRKFLRIVV